MVKEEKLNKFNMPLYSATTEEVRQLAEAEGSFLLNKLETLAIDWSVHTTQDSNNQAKFLAGSSRAVTESLLANTFGEAIIDDLFSRFKSRVREHMITIGPVEYYNFLLASVTRKTRRLIESQMQYSFPNYVDLRQPNDQPSSFAYFLFFFLNLKGAGEVRKPSSF